MKSRFPFIMKTIVAVTSALTIFLTAAYLLLHQEWLLPWAI